MCSKQARGRDQSNWSDEFFHFFFSPQDLKNKSTHLIFHRPQKTTEYGKARLEDLDLIIQNCGIVDKEGGVVINEK
jgi:hypothetical protein